MPFVNAQISNNYLRSVDCRIENESVFVVSECHTDAKMASELLMRSGYRSERLSDISSLAQTAEGRPEYSEQYVATVICHRKSTRLQPQALAQLPPEQCVIVLSDCESEQTVVSLLNSGAHYFFNLSEPESLLQARIEAALRPNGISSDESFSVGDIHFDTRKRRVIRRGIIIDLSPKEYELAYYLFSNRHRMVCNSELMTSVWSLPTSNDTRRIDTATCRLRKKLLLNTENGWQLKRLRNVGYRLTPVKEQSLVEAEFDQLYLAS